MSGGNLCAFVRACESKGVVWFTVTVALMTSQEFKVGRASPSEVEGRGERRERGRSDGVLSQHLTVARGCAPKAVDLNSRDYPPIFLTLWPKFNVKERVSQWTS